MTVLKLYSDIFIRLSKANSKVSESRYSISAPIGTPWAIFVITTFSFDNIFDIYNAVVSPSILGLTAIIISLIFSFFTLSSKFEIFISSGVILSSGDIRPPSTWYFPLKTPIFSKVIKFLGSSTIHKTPVSCVLSEHISHISVSDKLLQMEHFLIFVLVAN